MTTPDIAAIRARLAAAQCDEWSASRQPGGGGWIHDADGYTVAESMNDATHDLIAHAPADLRALCDEVERLRSLPSHTHFKPPVGTVVRLDGEA